MADLTSNMWDRFSQSILVGFSPTNKLRASDYEPLRLAGVVQSGRRWDSPSRMFLRALVGFIGRASEVWASIILN